MHEFHKGVLYALGAAALNATIGVLTKFVVAMGLQTDAIAALKTLIGFAIVSAIGLGYSRTRWYGQWREVALCAFFGIFVLFFFETAAYAHEAAANVVVTLMAFAALSAIVLGWPLLGDRPSFSQWVGLGVALAGVAMVAGVSVAQSPRGVMLAALAGTGYGVFSVLVKKFGLPGGFALTARLLLFGSFYLATTVQFDALTQVRWSPSAIGALILLAVFPTVLGFVCTTRAIQFLAPGRVQTLELAEPLFAGVFAFVLLREVPSPWAVAGGTLVVLGLYVSTRQPGAGRSAGALPSTS
jgi:drug/metabolite transporter (DMT)-like permease